MPGFASNFVKWLTNPKNMEKDANGLTAVDNALLQEELARLGATGHGMAPTDFPYTVTWNPNPPKELTTPANAHLFYTSVKNPNPKDMSGKENWRWWTAIDGQKYPYHHCETNRDGSSGNMGVDMMYELVIQADITEKTTCYGPEGVDKPPPDSPFRMSVRTAAIAAKAKKKKQAAIGFATIVTALVGATVGVGAVKLIKNDVPSQVEVANLLPQDPRETQPVDPAGAQPVDPASATPTAVEDTGIADGSGLPTAPGAPAAPQTPEGADNSDLPAAPEAPVAPTTTPVTSTTAGTEATTTTTTVTTTTAAPAMHYAHAQGGPTLCPEYARANQLTRTFKLRDRNTGDDPVNVYDGASATLTLTGTGRDEQANGTVSDSTVTFVWTFSPLLETNEDLIPSLQVSGTPMDVSVNSIGFSQGNCTYP